MQPGEAGAGLQEWGRAFSLPRPQPRASRSAAAFLVGLRHVLGSLGGRWPWLLMQIAVAGGRVGVGEQTLASLEVHLSLENAG